jgi:hypothetical protein
MLSERSQQLIEQSKGALKRPIRLVLFTTDTGCSACPDALALVRQIKAHMGKIALETYDIVMDRDKTELYGIKYTPAVVVQDAEGRGVTFYGLIEDVFLGILLRTIHAMADERIWFPDDIRRTLKYLNHEVKVRVFIETDCPLCCPVAETAIGLAMESPLIDTDIIVASDFPELIRKYQLALLPKTTFGENLHLEGHVSETEFLEMIFQAEGIRPGHDRKCLVCGSASPEIICQNCKARIQAEAIDHKTRVEKGLQQP